MRFLLAVLPILIILLLMLVFHWGGHRAGPAGWLAGMIVAAACFGLNFETFWISQARGLLLSGYVLLVLWPALMLYHTVNQAGGIQAIAAWLESSLQNRGLLLVLMAWAFGGFLEGIAGFGIPIAIIAPMLTGLGVPPVTAVAAVATGHAWAVTFGDMGVVFQTLVGITGIPASQLAAPAASILGIACLLCGVAAAAILGELRSWYKIVPIAILMAAVQYLLAAVELIPVSAMFGGIAGMAAGILIDRRRYSPQPGDPVPMRPLLAAAASYGSLVGLIILFFIPGPVHDFLYRFAWIPHLPEARTSQGFITPAGPGTVYRFFLHPGIIILVVTLISILLYKKHRLLSPGSHIQILQNTAASSLYVSLGIIATVGLASLMDCSGMTLLLAEGLSSAMKTAYPFVAPLVGVLGAFATGSNNNSNVLFGSLQKQAALLLGLDPRWLLAAQTTGGALGSMIAPAKIIVGCSTTGLKNKDGEVLRATLPYGLLISLIIGGVIYLITRAT